jgi:hypothetical protein
MSKEPRMRCECCGEDMNRHAEKPDWSAGPGAEGYDQELGCAIEEIHQCPGCGASASRRAAS